jgi:hypothetical protein
VAIDRPRWMVGRVLQSEIEGGRVESDGKGRIRLRAGALPEDVIAALGLLCD